MIIWSNNHQIIKTWFADEVVSDSDRDSESDSKSESGPAEPGNLKGRPCQCDSDSELSESTLVVVSNEFRASGPGGVQAWGVQVARPADLTGAAHLEPWCPVISYLI